MKIYIAGKITGDSDYRSKFAEAQKILEERGYEVENPATLPERPDWGYEDYMKECYRMQQTCGATYILPDWVDSKGAKREVVQAQQLKHEIYYSIDDVPVHEKKIIIVDENTLEQKVLKCTDACSFLGVNAEELKELINSDDPFHGYYADEFAD